LKSFADYNPIAIFIFFISVTVPIMFITDPVLIFLSFFGSLTASLIICGGGKIYAFYFALVCVMSLINPLFYHNGATVLFILNNNPITLEAFLYGVSSSFMIVSVLMWFRIFSKIMTGDKLLYVFGSVSPKLSLILSMVFRYIPLFLQQSKRVEQSQKALGNYTDDSIIGKIKGKIRIFSVMVTWTLENGIVTADSMTARGYGTSKRTFFAIYRFRKVDSVLTFCSLIFSAVLISGIAFHAVGYDFYPYIYPPNTDILTILSYIFYGLLAMIPALNETEEGIKWNYLLSKT